MDDNLKKVMNGEPVKIYVQQSIEYGWIHFFESKEVSDYVLIGEADVVFNLASKDEAIQKAAELLDLKIQETYAKAEYEVGKIKDQKARLLALTHDSRADNEPNNPNPATNPEL